MVNIILGIAIISLAVGFVVWAFGGNFLEGTRSTAGCLLELIGLIILGVIGAVVAFLIFG